MAMKNLISRISITLMIVVGLMTSAFAPNAHADWFEETYPGFFKLQTPGMLQATIFGGGFVSDKYGVVQEGAQVEQSITPYVGAFARATGYQLWIGNGFQSPLNPNGGAHARLNFGRFQGGVDFTIAQGVHLYISGGRDAGDSHANIIEGDFSGWLWLHSKHPVNLSFSSIHDYENGVTSTEIDLQAILISTEKYMVLGGIGGAMYFGGFLTNAQGRGGRDMGLY